MAEHHSSLCLSLARLLFLAILLDRLSLNPSSARISPVYDIVVPWFVISARGERCCCFCFVSGLVSRLLTQCSARICITHIHDVLFLFSNSDACLNCCEPLSLCVCRCFVLNQQFQMRTCRQTHTLYVVIVDSFIHFYWTDQAPRPSLLDASRAVKCYLYIDTSSIDGGANNYYSSQINSRNLLINKLQTDMYRRCLDLAYYDLRLYYGDS